MSFTYTLPCTEFKIVALYTHICYTRRNNKAVTLMFIGPCIIVIVEE